MKRRRVSELMNPQVITLRPHMTVREAEQILATRRVSGAPVVDAHGHVLGVISLNDLVRHQSRDTTAGESGQFFTSLEEYRDLARFPAESSTTPVEQLMSGKVYSVSREASAAVAANIMRERRIHRLIVTDRGILVGVVTSLDLLRVVEENC